MSALPEGFYIARRIFADVALEDVRAAVAWEQRTFTMYGRTVSTPRLTAWYGDAAYTYSRQRHEPAIVASLRDRAAATTGATYNSVLANLYRDGADSVAWHADDEPELGAEPTIASLSIGAPRAFQIRTKRQGGIGGELRRTITLEHGDLLVMTGRSQLDYQHAIPKTRRPVRMRANLTFRHVG